jgi:type IV pilus biogenesis protein CpaD/CtpE
MTASSITRAAVALALALLASGCAQGPADIIESAAVGPAATEPQAPVLSAEERDRLARDLDDAASRQSSEGRAAVETLPSAMALSVIRQQQVEEARSLLDAATAGAGEVTAPPGEAAPACDPSTDPACIPTTR